MDILRRSLAPIAEKAWEEIDEQASLTLKGNLSARSVVDFDGPHGWGLGAVNLGRLDTKDKEPVNDVTWGIRQVLPLIEIRVPFKLSQMEIDSVSRGIKDPELEPLEDAARKTALFEENAIYHGFKEGDITGILQASPHKALTLGKDPSSYTAVIEKAEVAIEQAGIGGPYTLVLGTEPYSIIMQGDQKGYPLKKRILDIIRGDILWSPALEGGVLVSTRGDDFEFTVGQDLSIGYASHTRDDIELYFTESFTFRTIEPAAAIELKLGK